MAIRGACFTVYRQQQTKNNKKNQSVTFQVAHETEKGRERERERERNFFFSLSV
jgi:hypothetical protein